MHRVPSLTDRFLGCLLGLATGDAFGAPFEGLGPYDIYQGFGFAGGSSTVLPWTRCITPTIRR